MLVAERETAEFYEAVVDADGAKRDPKIAANWITGDFFRRLNADDLEIADSPVSAAQLGGLIDLIADGTISGKIAKDVFDEMFDNGKDADAIVEEKGLKQISDSGEISAVIDQIIADNPEQADQYRQRQHQGRGLVHGTGHEGDAGQGEPADGQPAAPGKAGQLGELRHHIKVVMAGLDPAIHVVDCERRFDDGCPDQVRA